MNRSVEVLVSMKLHAH